MKALLLACGLLLAALPASAQDQHPCADHARQSGMELLRFHGQIDQTDLAMDIDANVTPIAPVGALRGGGQLDVLEVWGYVYRTEYRMRFVYAQGFDSCVLLGQEIFENSDPY